MVSLSRHYIMENSAASNDSNANKGRCTPVHFSFFLHGLPNPRKSLPTLNKKKEHSIATSVILGRRKGGITKSTTYGRTL